MVDIGGAVTGAAAGGLFGGGGTTGGAAAGGASSLGGIGQSVTGILQSVSAERQARAARRSERLRQRGIITQTEAQTRSLQREAQRELSRQRARFAAAGVSGTAGTPALFTQASLFETIEEITLLQETAFLELLASRKRQKAASQQEREAQISKTINIITGSAQIAGLAL